MNNNKIIEIIEDFENEKEKKGRKKLIITLAVMVLFLGILTIQLQQHNNALERENALLKTTLQQQTKHAPTSPASLEVPPLPPTYSEFIKFNGWTVCESGCGVGSI